MAFYIRPINPSSRERDFVVSATSDSDTREWTAHEIASTISGELGPALNDMLGAIGTDDRHAHAKIVSQILWDNKHLAIVRKTG